MNGGFTTKPGRRSLVQEKYANPEPAGAPGKRTLVEQHSVQHKAVGSPAEGAAQAAVAQAGASTGEPLEESTRARFEASLGADLSAVRVHAGSDSAAAAQQLGA